MKLNFEHEAKLCKRLPLRVKYYEHSHYNVLRPYQDVLLTTITY